MNNIIIIPTLNPTVKLIKLIDNLLLMNLDKIIVVDDGSDSQNIFDVLNKKVIIIHHKSNLGKGAAIKTGIKESIKYFNNINAYIFVDSDGQHDVEDIKNISNILNNNNEIIFGVRNFKSENVPFKSKFGNNFSHLFYKITTGNNLSDTQTGLRGIPFKYYEELLKIKGERYDYEMNFLYFMANNKLDYIEIPIKTIYENNNAESHFNPIKDALLIYKEPLKFIFSSISSSFIDIGSFILLNLIISNVFFTNIIARLISGIYNYKLNKYWCFNKKEGSQLISYFILFFIQMLISSSLLKLLTTIFSHELILKIMIDLMLFVVNYIIEKRLIFKGDNNHENI